LALETADLERGLSIAFDAFLRRYGEGGGHLFYGFYETGDPSNYRGPMIWSEGDCAFRFALELESQFERHVHLEMPIGRTYFADFDKERDTTQFIDVVVSDLSNFDHAAEVFAERSHDIFVEAKYIPRRRSRRFLRDSHRTIHAVLADAKRLQVHLDRQTRCSAAAVLVIDDDDYLERAVFDREFDSETSSMFEPAAFSWSEWPKQVWPLLASGRQVARRCCGQPMPTRCPNATCSSPRVAPILCADPTPQLEAASQRGELVLAGSLGRFDDRAAWQCIDCGAAPSRSSA
jgi:hypothetical protein